MIKAVLRNDEGLVTLILGLSRLNTESLLEGKPIAFGVTVNDTPLRITIVGGETEEATAAQLAERFPQLKGRPDLLH